MTQFSAGIGGSDRNAAANAIAASAQERGIQQFAPRTATNWNDPEHATPKPAPKRHYGARGEQSKQVADVPQLPERLIRVKAVAPAGYYTLEGLPIGSDDWVTLPISPSIMKAVASGDLERDESYVDSTDQQSSTTDSAQTY
jgi:hypothetical protein